MSTTASGCSDPIAAIGRDTLGDAEDSEVFERIYGPLRRFAAAVSRIDEDPDDLVQEALTRTLRIHPLAELNNPYGYLCRVIRSLRANEARSSARRQRAVTRLGDTPSVEPRYSSDLGILFSVSPADRAVLYLADVDGRPLGEVAQILGISLLAARSRASRARRALRRLLEQET